MVEIGVGVVERDLAGGKLVCPGCPAGGVLGPWGWARRRVLRIRRTERWVRPRRGRCRSCGATHVLLPTLCLGRRRDAVEVIGEALLAWQAGAGHRRVAAEAGVPATTVRGWLRRFAVNAGFVAGQFMALAHRLDADLGRVAPRGSPVGDALEAIGVAAAAAVRLFGPVPVWQFVAGASGGCLLATRARPFPALG